MKQSHKKTALILAAMIVLVAGIALVGNTFATDVEKEGTSTASDLKVSFQYYNANGTYVNVPAVASYGEENAESVTDGMFWCPGRTEIIYLKVTNNELFPVKGSISLTLTDNGKSFGNTLTYAVIEGDLLSDKSKDHPADWDSFYKAATKKGAFTSSANGTNYDITTDKLINPSKSDYVAIAIHMSNNASNDYQNSSMKVDLKLHVDADYQTGSDPTKADSGNN